MNTYPNLISFLIFPIAIVLAVMVLLLRDRIFTGNYRLGSEWGPETKRFKRSATGFLIAFMLILVTIVLVYLTADNPTAWKLPAIALMVLFTCGIVFILVLPHPAGNDRSLEKVDKK